MASVTLDIVPYLPSTEWIVNGMVTAGTPAREATRTRIASNTPGGQLLTIPVRGGSSSLKRIPGEGLITSEHGDWRRVHIAALDAAYGREPFFQHLFPFVEAVISSCETRIETINGDILKALLDFMDYDEAMGEIRRMRASNPERCSNIKKRLAKKIALNNSFFEPLVRFGRDTAFIIL